MDPLIQEAEILDQELQRVATGATIHRIRNLRSAVKMLVSLLEAEPTEANRNQMRRILGHIRIYCLRGKCPCKIPCSSYKLELCRKK